VNAARRGWWFFGLSGVPSEHQGGSDLHGKPYALDNQHQIGGLEGEGNVIIGQRQRRDHPGRLEWQRTSAAMRIDGNRFGVSFDGALEAFGNLRGIALNHGGASEHLQGNSSTTAPSASVDGGATPVWREDPQNRVSG
jgi:hypothetical protein